MSAQLQVSVVTPEETVVETTADSISLQLFDGEIGILPKHSPMIGRLGYGEMRIKNGSETTSYFVDGGFVQVVDDNVAVLTNRVIQAAELNAEEAEKQLSEGIAMSASGQAEMASRERIVSQARAQVRMAKKIN